MDSLVYTFSGGNFASYGCAPIDPTYWMNFSGDYVTVTFVTPQNYPAFRVWGMNDDDSASVTVNSVGYPMNSGTAYYDPKVVCGLSPGPDGVIFANGKIVGANSNALGNYSYNDVHLMATNVTSFTVSGISGAGWGFAGVVMHCPSSLSVTTTNTNPPCNGGCNAVAIANPGNGTPSYTYEWSPGGETTQTVSALCAGNYTVTVTDATGMSATAALTVSQPTPVTIAVTSVDASCSTCNDGYAWASGGGGTPPYHYEWGTVPIQSTDTAYNLAPGSYYVCVDDSNNCKACTTVVVSYTVGIASPASDIASTVIYPNPFMSHLIIKRGDEVITLFDYTGKEVLLTRAGDEETILNTENLANGLYFVRVENGTRLDYLRVVKTN